MVYTVVIHPHIDTGLSCRFPGAISAYNVLVDAVDVDLLLKCAVRNDYQPMIFCAAQNMPAQEDSLLNFCMMHRLLKCVLPAALASGHTLRSNNTSYNISNGALHSRCLVLTIESRVHLALAFLLGKRGASVCQHTLEEGVQHPPLLQSWHGCCGHLESAHTACR
jgi:hypothetical protein